MMLAGALITYAFSYYPNKESQAVQNSFDLALSHQIYVDHLGGNSVLFHNPSTQMWTNNDSWAFQASVNLSATFGVSIRCANGATYNGTGPFTCPDAIHAASNGVSTFANHNIAKLELYRVHAY